MQETLGLKNKKKVNGEEAFFVMFKKIAMSGDGFVDSSLIEEDETPAAAAAPDAAPVFPEASGSAPTVSKRVSGPACHGPSQTRSNQIHTAIRLR
jgi:hypothetical protein